jgi:hypothetical protein
MKTHILCWITFFQNCTVYETYRKMWWRTRGHKWRHNMVHTRCSWIGKATCTHAHAHAHAPECPHARTHRPISNIYCFFTATMILERTSVLRYTYIPVSTREFSKRYLSCKCRIKPPVHFSSPHTYHMANLPHISRFNHQNNIRWGVQMVKFLVNYTTSFLHLTQSDTNAAFALWI